MHNPNPTVILACKCGAVALSEGPAKHHVQPVTWQQAAPAICPQCLSEALGQRRRERRYALCQPSEINAFAN